LNASRTSQADKASSATLVNSLTHWLRKIN
jgi:hypothetical protein